MNEPTGKCELCGEPMPEGETMFRYHGYSCDCPKPPLPRPEPVILNDAEQRWLNNLRGTEGHNSSTVILIDTLIEKLRVALKK